jgi:5-(carboxyamino)imidazole ribonucleotide mutase
MPPGVPVATVAINGARSGGILGAQILATADPASAQQVRALKAGMERMVLDKVDNWKGNGPCATDSRPFSGSV